MKLTKFARVFGLHQYSETGTFEELGIIVNRAEGSRRDMVDALLTRLSLSHVTDVTYYTVTLTPLELAFSVSQQVRSWFFEGCQSYLSVLSTTDNRQMSFVQQCFFCT
jgi:hypothetical protein